ncbi:hypothetical protein [Spirosoma sp. 209]|uniref:hypothetical protein n=1 Tax=Spirosoma sp. 209 TaxID=1955701 RepID=UPI00098D4B9C|nr:hypothetical protein [Spirosoma sp. 209]
MAAHTGNTFAEGNDGGRPSKYKEEYAEQAYKLCLLGATDEELADFFGVHKDTIYAWRAAHQEFSDSIKAGKISADMNVVNGLYNKAIGAEWEEEQAFKVKRGQFEEEIEIVKVKRVAPPDFQAISLWLRNRQPTKWRDKVDHEHSGPDGGPITFFELPRKGS